MTIQTDNTGAATVDQNYPWLPLRTCPRGTKVQLLSIGRVAVYGHYHPGDSGWLAWAPLPRWTKGVSDQ